MEGICWANGYLSGFAYGKAPFGETREEFLGGKACGVCHHAVVGERHELAFGEKNCQKIVAGLGAGSAHRVTVGLTE